MRIAFFFLGMVFFFQANSGINSLTGPVAPCPNGSNQCLVNYSTVLSGFGIVENVVEVKWDFYQNTQLIKTVYSSSFPSTAFPSATAQVLAGTLPTGSVQVSVRVKVFRQIGPNYSFVYFSRSLNFFVGLPAPTSITGASLICPGTSTVYTTATVANAQSYTWEVPSWWQVNGISGPIISGQGQSVNITVPFCDNSRFLREYPSPTYGVVKVKAVSASCGSGGYKQMTINVDYPLVISEVINGDGTLTLSANYTQFYPYIWSTPPNWEVVNNNGYMITYNTFGLEGQVVLRYQSLCGCVFDLAYNHYPPEPPPPPPPPCCELIQAFPNPASERITLRSDGKEIREVWVETDGQFQCVGLAGIEVALDISNLKPGPHILRIKDSNGKFQSLRIVKSR